MFGSWEEGECLSKARHCGFWIRGSSETAQLKACANCQVALALGLWWWWWWWVMGRERGQGSGKTSTAS